MTSSTFAVGRVLREPLVHFLVLGALLFAWYEWRGGAPGPGSSRITVTPGLVAHLASGFARTWQRPPTDTELKSLIDDYVKEEIATREALAMGLDRDDTILRRRLRQKLEFLVEDPAGGAAPTDAELEAWLRAHPDAVPAEPRIALRQVFVNAQRRGAGARPEAERLLAQLAAAGPGARTDALGDPTMLPGELPPGARSEVERVFGQEFAAGVERLQPGRWAGPIASGYGLHLVLVTSRDEAAAPALSDVRPAVEREILAERRRRQLETMYEALLRKYTVVIDMPDEGSGR